jgi:hypothetical protein
MISFRQYRSPSKVAATAGLLGAFIFLYQARSNWKGASARFGYTSAELLRLEQLNPYPNTENIKELGTQAISYRAVLLKLEGQLQQHILTGRTLTPSEFQSRLRVETASIIEKAKTQRVQLPDKFQLGFDSYTSGLPNEIAAPRLGQELTQVGVLVGLLIDAGIDSLVSLHRAALREEQESKPTDRQKGELSTVEVTFVSTESSAREALNRIARSDDQIFVVQNLKVRNQQDKAPPREAGKTKEGALNFIVGEERVEITAVIEIPSYPQ